jgi:hypothetical protein
MGRVLESRKISPHTLTGVGIAVHSGGLHIGVMYRAPGIGTVKLLHLMGHHKLSSDDVRPDYVVWIRPAIKEDRAMAIGTMCRRIWKQNSKGLVSYGLSKPGRFFDSDGRFLKGPALIGLTCASFVLEVFHQAGMPLVDYDSWPHPTEADVARQNDVLDGIAARNPQFIQHVQVAKSELGNTRYAPLEVAGAGTAIRLPTNHPHCSKVANQIKELLVKLRAVAPIP